MGFYSFLKYFITRNIVIIAFIFVTVLWACSKSDTSASTATTTTTISTPAPADASFTPKSGAVGTTVTITGSNFSTPASSNTVKFNGIAATVSSAGSTQLVVQFLQAQPPVSVLQQVQVWPHPQQILQRLQPHLPATSLFLIQPRWRQYYLHHVTQVAVTLQAAAMGILQLIPKFMQTELQFILL